MKTSSADKTVANPIKEKIKKLFNNVWFVISLVTLLLVVVDNREEIKQCVKELLNKESYVNFKNDIVKTFSSYTDKVSRIYTQAIGIIAE